MVRTLPNAGNGTPIFGRKSVAANVIDASPPMSKNLMRVFSTRARVASGSQDCEGMVVVPCSMKSLAGIANGLSRNLVERAADVMLKERRTLVLVPRETPLSAIHLENLLKLARAGAVILPPSPGFYAHPATVDDLVDFVVARVLDQLGVVHSLLPRWGEARVAPPTIERA